MSEQHISLPITFSLPDDERFWLLMRSRARRIDEEAGQDESSYTRTQAFVVIFHHDGLKTIGELAASLRQRDQSIPHPGWAVDTSWDQLPSDREVEATKR